MKDNSFVLFKLKQYILCSKGTSSSENFWDFQVLWSKVVKCPKSILKWQVNSSSNFASFLIAWDITPLYSCFFYFGLKDPIKIQILRLPSALVKICLISHVIFRTINQFFFKFRITLQCHERQLLFTFLGQTLNTLHSKSQ